MHTQYTFGYFRLLRANASKMASASSKPSKKKLKEMEKVMQNSADWLSRALDKAKTGFEDAADNILSEKTSGILSGAIPVPISYEDSDQSPLKYKKAQLLRNLWAGGMDYMPYNQGTST